MAKKHRTGTLFKRGNIWWLKYMVDGKYYNQSLKTTDKTKAEQKQKELMRPIMAAEKKDVLAIMVGRFNEAEKEQAQADETAHPPLTIGKAWDAYDASEIRPDSSERTLAGYESAFKRFVKWMKETYPDPKPTDADEAPAYSKAMRDVTEETAAAYAKKLQAAGVTASTYNQHIQLLRLVWRVLAKDIRADANPWMNIQRKKLGKQKLSHRRRNLTPAQFENLLKCAGSADMHDLLFTLAWTGQRLADGVLLRWDQIEFKHKVITFHPIKLRRTAKEIFVPLLPPLVELLKMRKENAAGPHVFPELVAEYERDSSMVSKRIQAAFDKANLKPRELMPDVSRAVVKYGAHSLRHYFATQALAAGMPSEIIKAITGHTSDAMLNHYQHVDARMIAELANKLSAKPAKEQKALPAPQEASEPLPRWAVKMLNTMTDDNWKTVRKEMNKIGKKNKKQAESQKMLPAAGCSV